MDIDETETGTHTSDHLGEDTKRMAPDTAFHTMAPDTEASCAMDIGKRSLLSDTTAAWTDFTRSNGLSGPNGRCIRGAPVESVWQTTSLL